MGFSYTGFAALLRQHYTSLPDVEFVESSAFAQVHQFLMEQLKLDYDSETTTDEVIDIVVSQLEVIMLDTNFVNMTKILDLSAGKLTQEVSGAFNLLRHNISDLVSSLSEEVAAAQAEELVRAGAEILVSENTTPSVDFGILQWGSLQQDLYRNEVIDAACDVANIVQKEVTGSNVVYALRKLPLQGFMPIDLSLEATNDICDKLNKVIPTYELEDVTEVFKMVTLSNMYNIHCLAIQGKASTMAPDNYSFVLDRTQLVTQVLKGLATIPLDLSEETTTALVNNISLMRTVNYIGEFYLLNVQDKLSGILILSRNLLNGSEVSKFTNSGGTFVDIAYHIRAIYTNKEIPYPGVSTSRVLELRESVNTNIVDMNARLMTTMRIVKSKAMNKAYHNVLNKYLLSLTPESLPENESVKNFYQKHYPKILSTLDRFRVKHDNVEDALYTFILQIWHNNSLVQTLYNYLGKEYARLAESDSGAADTAAIAMSDAYVVSTLVGEYLASKHCKIK